MTFIQILIFYLMCYLLGMAGGWLIYTLKITIDWLFKGRKRNKNNTNPKNKTKAEPVITSDVVNDMSLEVAVKVG